MKRILVSNQICLVSEYEFEQLFYMKSKLDSLSIDEDEYYELKRDYNDYLVAIEGRKENQKRPIIHSIFPYY